MVASGYSPSVRLFEAAACAVPIITDEWPGLELFFEPDVDILVAKSHSDTLRYLRMDRLQARGIGTRGRSRVLSGHTSAQRAMQLESYVDEVRAPSVMKPTAFAAREAVHGS
jgi:spore maturation protein CgeB